MDSIQRVWELAWKIYHHDDNHVEVQLSKKYENKTSKT